jgi:hypothetical protein
VILVKGRRFSQFGCRISKDAAVGGAVVEAVAFHIHQGDHVGGIFGDRSFRFGDEDIQQISAEN